MGVVIFSLCRSFSSPFQGKQSKSPIWNLAGAHLRLRKQIPPPACKPITPPHTLFPSVNLKKTIGNMSEFTIRQWIKYSGESYNWWKIRRCLEWMGLDGMVLGYWRGVTKKRFIWVRSRKSALHKVMQIQFRSS